MLQIKNTLIKGGAAKTQNCYSFMYSSLGLLEMYEQHLLQGRERELEFDFHASKIRYVWILFINPKL